jgi:hypothetical protein
LAGRRRVTKLSGVNLEWIDAYKGQRTDEKAAQKTVHTEVVVIRQLVSLALSRKMITANLLELLNSRSPSCDRSRAGAARRSRRS